MKLQIYRYFAVLNKLYEGTQICMYVSQEVATGQIHYNQSCDDT